MSLFSESVESMFSSDKKLRKSVLGAFTECPPDEDVYAYLPACQALDSSNWLTDWIIFTQYRVGLGRLGGILGGGEAFTIGRDEVELIGVGESTHDIHDGRTQTHVFASITLELKDGRRFTRHSYLGSDEEGVNDGLVYTRAELQGVKDAGFQIGDGPAWRSSETHTTTYGIGYGVWISP